MVQALNVVLASIFTI